MGDHQQTKPIIDQQTMHEIQIQRVNIHRVH